MADDSLSPRTFNREELAWAAGFFDGEGHTRVRAVQTNRKNPQVTIGLVISQAGAPELLERFKRAVGVGAVNGPYEYRHRRPTQKAFYSYGATSFENVQHCIACLWPWLGSVKRHQALEVLRRWHAQPRRWYRTRGHNRVVCIRGHRVEGANLYTTKSGYASCRECKRIWERNRSKKT